MRIKIFAVVDTNVIVSSIISKTGFPKTILEYIDKKNIIPIYDKRMLDEYYKVLQNQDERMMLDGYWLIFRNESSYILETRFGCLC